MEPSDAARAFAPKPGRRRPQPTRCRCAWISRPSFAGRPGTDWSCSALAASTASGEPKWAISARLRAGPTPEARQAATRSSRDHAAGGGGSPRSGGPRRGSAAEAAERACRGPDARIAAAPGKKTSSSRFASAITATPRSRAGPSEASPAAQLALAAVDHDQVRQRRELAVVAGVVRGDVDVALEARHPPAEHLRHRREVVGAAAIERANPKAAIVRAAAARPLRTRPSRRPCGCPSGSRCRSTRSASGARPAATAPHAGRRALRRGARGGVRPSAGPPRARAQRCARRARGSGASRRARPRAPRRARRGARERIDAAAETGSSTTTCAGTAAASRSTAAGTPRSPRAGAARLVGEVERLAVREHPVANLEDLRVGVGCRAARRRSRRACRRRAWRRAGARAASAPRSSRLRSTAACSNSCAVRGRGLHPLPRARARSPVVAAEEFDHAVDPVAVLLARDVADAGRAAAVDVVVEARRAGSPARLGAGARADQEDAARAARASRARAWRSSTDRSRRDSRRWRSRVK